MTQDATISKPMGDTVRFHCNVTINDVPFFLLSHTCQVKHLGEHHLVWRRGYDFLATGPTLISPDSRMRVEMQGQSSPSSPQALPSPSGGSSSLVISGLRSEDKGAYVCQLSTIDGLISTTHTLDVLGEKERRR